MADNVAITAGAGTVIATDDVSGVQFQRVKLDVGGDGVSVPVVGELPVSLASQPLPTGAATEAAQTILTAKFPSALANDRLKVALTDAAGANFGTTGNPVFTTRTAAPITYTDRSGSIVTAGVAVSIAANASRRVFSIQNTSAFDIRVNDLGTASLTAGYLVAPGRGFAWGDGEAPLTAISVWGGTAGQTFTAREG